MNTQRIERAHASMIRKLLVMDLSYLRDVTGSNMDAQKWKLVLSRFFTGEFYILRLLIKQFMAFIQSLLLCAYHKTITFIPTPSGRR